MIHEAASQENSTDPGKAGLDLNRQSPPELPVLLTALHQALR